MVDLLLSWNPNSTESPRTTAVRGECQEGSTALTWANEQSVSLKFKKGSSRGPWWNPLSAIPKRSLVHKGGERERGSLTWRQLHSRAAPGSGGLGRGGLQHQRHLRSIKETGAARLEPGTQCTATADVQSTFKTTFLFWNILFWSEVQMSNRLWRTMEGGQALNVRPPNVQSTGEGYGH